MQRTKKAAIILIAFFFFILMNEKSFGQCNPPTFGIYGWGIKPTSAVVIVPQNFNYLYIIEYGPVGFTPGVDENAGPGGTAQTFFGVQSDDTLFNLTPDTYYDCYVRTKCTAVQYSANSPVMRFKTQMDCDAVTIPVNTMTTAHLASDIGSWQLCSGSGREQIFKFIAPTTGEYVLLTEPLAHWTEFYFKSSSAGCVYQNWTCLSYFSMTDISQVSLGQLTAGNSYYIALDPNTTNFAYDVNFRIESSSCNRPSNVIETDAKPTSFTVHWDSSSSSIIEYGPRGFIPGTGNTPGQGTMYYLSGNHYDFTNVSGDYDFYLRQVCSSGGYSANSNRLIAYTAPCTTVTNYNNFGFPLSIYFDGKGYWDDYSGTTCGGWNLYGKENFVRFTAPCSASFDIEVVKWQLSSYYDMYWKETGTCDATGISCPQRTSTSTYTDHYLIGPLTAGISYDLFFDVEDSSTIGWPGNQLDVTINSPKPSNLQLFNIQPTSLEVSWVCDCSNMVIEYGPAGFTPGTGSTAGVNGTLFSNISSPYTISGLLPNTLYDIYLRSECNSFFSENVGWEDQQTALDCDSAIVTDCGVLNTYQTTWWKNGAWLSNGCNSYNDAVEKLYSFTPSVTGVFSLYVLSSFGGNSWYTYITRYFFKADTSECNEFGWICLGTDTADHNGHDPIYFSFDTLQAGVTYLILIDGVNVNSHNHYSSFRIECPNVCSEPIISGINLITPSSCQVYSLCNSCFGDVYLEYGPTGFTPGTDSTAGGGTVIPHVVFPITLSGLAGGVTYDVYARTYCPAMSGFSNNIVPKTFTTCSVGPNNILSSATNNVFCAGDSVTLYQSGGNLVTGGEYKWYTGSCGGTLAGTGDSIRVAPTGNTTYYVRAEAACGNSYCTANTINLFTDSLYANPTTFCPGTTTTLYVIPSLTGSTYTWLKDGIVISGATAATYTVDTTGLFNCYVTNGSCADTTNTIAATVSLSLSPVITFNGTDSICYGQSKNISGPYYGAGYTYSWLRDSVIIPGATNSNYFATQPGTYILTVTNGACTGSSNSVTFYLSTPFNASAFSSGSVNLCSGDSIYLVASPNDSGYIFQWRKNGVNINGAYNDTLVVKDPGSYAVVVRNSASCSDTSMAIIVTVHTAPVCQVVATDSIICSNESVTLTSISNPGSTLQWQLNAVNIAGATDSFFVASGGGTYTCTASDTCGLAVSNSVTVVQDIVSQPSITGSFFTRICLGDSITFSTPAVNGYTYQWYRYQQPIAGATATNYTVRSTGGYRVHVTDSFGCQNQSAIRFVFVGCAVRPPPNHPDRFAENQEKAFEAIVYPNPSLTSFTIEFIGSESKFSLNVYDIMGQRMDHYPELSPEENFQFGGNLAPGIYQVEIIQGDQRKNIKIIKD